MRERGANDVISLNFLSRLDLKIIPDILWIKIDMFDKLPNKFIFFYFFVFITTQFKIYPLEAKFTLH